MVKDPCPVDSHVLVFEGSYQCSQPPRYTGICTACGELLWSPLSTPPTVDLNAFAAALLRFHGDNPNTRQWARLLRSRRAH